MYPNKFKKTNSVTYDIKNNKSTLNSSMSVQTLNTILPNIVYKPFSNVLSNNGVKTNQPIISKILNHNRKSGSNNNDKSTIIFVGENGADNDNKNKRSSLAKEENIKAAINKEMEEIDEFNKIKKLFVKRKDSRDSLHSAKSRDSVASQDSRGSKGSRGSKSSQFSKEFKKKRTTFNSGRNLESYFQLLNDKDNPPKGKKSAYNKFKTTFANKKYNNDRGLPSNKKERDLFIEKCYNKISNNKDLDFNSDLLSQLTNFFMTYFDKSNKDEEKFNQFLRDNSLANLLKDIKNVKNKIENYNIKDMYDNLSSVYGKRSKEYNLDLNIINGAQ